MSEAIPENKMGTMPVGPLVLSMSLPIMVSMLIQALYNVVDSIFVAQISEDALTAVSLAFPYQNLMIAVAVGTAVGVNALLSRSLGEKNFETANRTAENAIFLTILSYLVFLVLGFTVSRAYFVFQTDNTAIIEAGTIYLTICSTLSFGIFVEITMERLLQATGRTLQTMFTQGLGAIINIILDPVLIFGLGPFPEMGVAGAAAATVIGQIMSSMLALFLNARMNHDLQLSFRNFRPNGDIIRRIYTVGVPSIIMNSISSVMTFGMNQILIAFSSTATAVLGIYIKVQSFVFMPVFGLNNGMVPIVAYNYGARKKKRLKDTVKVCVFFAMLIMLVGLLIIQLLPAQILGLFKASDYMLSIGVPALRTISWSFLLAGFSVIASSTFQALGNGFLSMVISIVRQLVVLLPAAWLLSLSGQLDLVWWSFPIAEVVALVLCLLFLRHIFRQVVEPLEGPAQN